jgi:FMN-dependent oxidoreductase (nitrilotriacetate monooxygenase family)
MTMSDGRLRLAAMCFPPGYWYMPDASPVDMFIEQHVHFAQVAERGKMDMVFFADSAAVAPAFFLPGATPEKYAKAARCVKLEPLTVLAALAMATKDIGLVSTATTTYYEPFTLARMFATIDHISHGRAGWNLVTSQNVDEAQNFNRDEHVEHGARYARAEEFYDVVTGLWDSWEDDAVIRDRATGRYIDPDKLHFLNHEGEHFRVRGPLNIARAPQGYPVIAQAGSSEPGRRLASRVADLVFTAQTELPGAKAFYADLKQRAVRHGRNPDHIKIMPGIDIVLGRTDEEAQEKCEAMKARIADEDALATIQRLAGHVNLADYPMDGPLPELPPSNAARSRQQMLIDLGRKGMTIRQLARHFAFGSGHQVFVGTAKGLADLMQEWQEAGAADGFTILSPYMPGPLEQFVAEVIPELQRRGLFRTEYEGHTLRENLGLPRPENRYTAARKAASTVPTAAE